MRSLTILAAAVLVPSLVACVVDSRNSNPPSGRPTPAPTTQPSQTPMIVVVDTNQTMNAKGGDGVGVFVEYQAGGHWKVWMTCDTNKSALDCDFDVTASAPYINNASPTPGSSAAESITQTGALVEARALTSTDVNGFTFDTAPGARVTLTASASGIQSGDFFFWVQDGKVNGGYNGGLTNPLSFDTSKP